MKIINDFGDLTFYKPVDIGYYDQYYDLLEMNADEGAKYGRTDVLIVNAEKGEWPDQEAIDRAATKGHLSALIWLKSKNLIPTEYGLDDATSEGYLEVLQLYPKIMNKEYADFAARFGYLDILKWLATLNILPTSNGIDYAASGGYLDILEWAAQKHIYPTSTGGDKAALYGHYNTLEWLLEHGIRPTQRGVNKSSMTGSLKIVKLLASAGFYPNQKGANYALGLGHYHISDWLTDQKILPNKEEATRKAIEMPNMQIVKWLDTRGLFAPTDESVFYLLQMSRDKYFSPEQRGKILELAKWVTKWLHIRGNSLDIYFIDFSFPKFVDWYYEWLREHQYDPYPTLEKLNYNPYY
jgi:hypothetical protein